MTLLSRLLKLRRGGHKDATGGAESESAATKVYALGDEVPAGFVFCYTLATTAIAIGKNGRIVWVGKPKNVRDAILPLLLAEAQTRP